MKHFLFFTVAIVCLVLVVIYGLEPALEGVTAPRPQGSAMDGLSGSIAHGMKYPGR